VIEKVVVAIQIQPAGLVTNTIATVSAIAEHEFEQFPLADPEVPVDRRL
jgi:hypothetical protein